MDSTAQALALAKREINKLKETVNRPRAVARDGLDGTPGRDGMPGRDGIPGRDGVSPDTAEIVEQLTAEVAKLGGGSDGKDGENGRRGAQGIPGPGGLQGDDGPTGLNGQTGEPGPTGTMGPRGSRGPVGPAGKDGASVTDVKFEGGTLSVSIDGVSRVVGKIKIPLGPFTPGGGGGGGSRGGGGDNSFTNLNNFLVTSVDTSSSPQSVVVPSALIAVDYNFLTIKDESNNAATNNITITTEGSEKIDVTLDSVVVNADSGGLQLYSHNGNLFSW